MQSLKPKFTFKIRQPRLKAKIILLAGLFFLFSIFAVPARFSGEGNGIVAAQTALTGEWTAKVYNGEQKDRESKQEWNPTDRRDSIQINLTRRSNKGENNFGSSIPYADFEGLTRDLALSTNPNMTFRLVREAGTIDFQGSFQAGKGAGNFTFTPNQTFLSAMRTRGFEEMTENQMFAATTINVTTKAVDDLRGAGFKLTLDDVFKAVIFKITPQFIAEMNSIGFKNLDMEDLVKARIFKITPEFSREVASLGFAEQPMESLVKMRIFKITPQFIRETRSAGFENLGIEELVKFRIFKIDADFIQRTRANGYTGNDPEELVRMKIHDKSK
jgi:predicted metallopeptidase